MAYSNSALVSYTRLSPNHSGIRSHSIDRITPHCVVGQCSVETIGEIFENTSRQASSNYGIGADGRVGMYVEEKNRSWCSSSGENDNRAVTIECASDLTEPFAFNSAVYAKLIELCTDICRRNGKKKLLWLGDKMKTLDYSPAADEMLLTVHRWFASKSCPGSWLMARMSELAASVTARLAGESPAPAQEPDPYDAKKYHEHVYKVSINLLKRGDYGPQVLHLQQLLGANGFDCKCTGVFDDQTEQALKSFQSATGIDVDGDWGGQSFEALWNYRGKEQTS